MNYIILHLYYEDLWDEFWEKIKPILNDTNKLIITLPEKNKDSCSKYESESPYISCKVYPDRGADIRPFLCVINDLIQSGESINSITKIHTKKSLNTHPNSEFGRYWRRSLSQQLLEYNEYLSSFFLENVDVGLVAKKEFYVYEPAGSPNFETEKRGIERAMQLFNITVTPSYHYVTGTMFMTSFDYLKRLLENSDFNSILKETDEPYMTSGSLVHGIERIFGYGLVQYNKKLTLI